MSPDRAIRLDNALVARGLAPTRARARDAILRGCVTVDGQPATKAGSTVHAASAITIDDPAAGYASRGALKLIAALEAFALDPKARFALDIGASTGGFTDVLLRRGARHVVAVDVGQGQLAAHLATDPRVTDLSGRDSRTLTTHDLAQPVTALVADVSFISLRKALPTALSLTAPGAWLVALIKPQFELEPKAIGKGGIVTDPADVERAVAATRHWLDAEMGWSVLGTCPSPIDGKNGNAEHLIAAVRHG